MQQQRSAPPAHPATYPKQGTNKKAIAGFVLTIVGFLFLPIVFSTVGIILAIVARGEINRYPGEGGRGLTTAALVIGPLGFAFGLAMALVANL